MGALYSRQTIIILSQIQLPLHFLFKYPTISKQLRNSTALPMFTFFFLNFNWLFNYFIYCYRFLSVLGRADAKAYLYLSTLGHYSLFPLLFHKNLLPIKVFMLFTHSALAFHHLPLIYEVPKTKTNKSSGFQTLSGPEKCLSMHLNGLIIIFIYENVVHSALGLDKTLPFLPLMITSVYCAVGVFLFWISYYTYFLTFNTNKIPTFPTNTMSRFTLQKDK